MPVTPRPRPAAPAAAATGQQWLADGRQKLQQSLHALDGAAAGDLAASHENGEARVLSGLAAALRITALLQEYHCGWTDVIIGDPVLAKLCGRLGSEFAGEREAAYVLAVQRIGRRKTRWLATTRIPAVFQMPASQTPPTGAHAPASPPEPDVPEERSYPAPTGDWATTLEDLIAHRAWRDERERAILHILAERIAAGVQPLGTDAIWLRELWWQAELRAPLSPTAAE